MSEWWSYRPHDFLMFSPPIYWRLFEAQNRAWWPLQALLAVAAVALVAAAWRAADGAAAVWWRRLAVFGLAGSWLLSAWDFLVERYAPILWLADNLAWGFVLQAAGLVLLAVWAPHLGASRNERTGLAIACVLVVCYPLTAVLGGRPWAHAETWGLAPDPTALVSLAWLLAQQGRNATTRAVLRALWILPLAWCAFSAATLAVMGSWQAVWVGGVALLLVGLALRRQST
jgi:hypothetical protein